MKKILLATTALAVVGVVAPASADVNLSAFYEFGWASHSDDTTGDDMGADSHTFQNSEILFSFDVVSDMGLAYGASFELEGVADGEVSVEEGGGTVSTKVMDESSLYVKGDFGKVILGQNDFAHSSFQTWSPTHRGSYGQDDGHYYPRFATKNPSDNSTSTSVQSHGNNASYSDAEKVTYLSPNLGGLKFGFSWNDSNDSAGNDESSDQSFGVSYTLPDMMNGIGLKLTAASYDDGESGDGASSTSYGAKVTFDDLTLTASTAKSENGDSKDVTATEFGVGYSVSSDFSVGAAFNSSEDDANGHSVDTQSVSAQYIITPGLSATAAINNYDLADSQTNRSNDGSVLVFTIRGDF